MIPDAMLAEKEKWFERLGDPWLSHYREAIAEIRRLREELEQCHSDAGFVIPALRESLAAHQAVVRVVERWRKRKGHQDGHDCDLCNALRTVVVAARTAQT